MSGMGDKVRTPRKALYAALALALLGIGIILGMGSVALWPRIFQSALRWRFLGGLAPGGFSDGPEKLHRVPEPADLVKLYPDIVVRQWSPKSPSVALTFDDGPDTEYTPKILDILRKYNVRATFFLIGKSAERHPDIVKRIVVEGHAIGNHTYHHGNLANMAPWQVVMELKRANTALARITNEWPLAVRPPYGALDPLAVEAIGREGYRVVLWTIDSLDWHGLSAEKVLANVMPVLKSGVIVLHHSAGGPQEDLGGMLDALPTIIETLQQQGYLFVTIPEVLEQHDAARKAMTRERP
ncbi:MAG: polysaccharide deacetylase family protein [Firmicutes bacterium]|nr:polysaccharide deacetylase family protein [Bacillota bacterium]